MTIAGRIKAVCELLDVHPGKLGFCTPLSSRPIDRSKNGSETIGKLLVDTRIGSSIRWILESSKELVMKDKVRVIPDKKTLK